MIFSMPRKEMTRAPAADNSNSTGSRHRRVQENGLSPDSAKLC